MKEKKKILYLGHCSYYTISNLAASIKEYSDEFSITVADLIMPDGGRVDTNNVPFDKVINLPKKRDTNFKAQDKRAALKDIMKDKLKRRLLMKRLFLLQYKEAKNYIEMETEERVFSKIVRSQFENFDIYHFHYAAPEFLVWLKYIPKGKKIIISLWGSDLYQTHGVRNYKAQYRAFEKARFITLNTNEMNEFFLNKFGRDFQSKVRRVFFILNDCRFSKIDLSLNSPLKEKFRRKYSIPGHKKILVAGYSSSSKQNHLEILKHLSAMKEIDKEKIHLVFPMMYGQQFESDSYLNKVKTEAEKTGMSNTFLTEYMTGDALHEFISAGDIKLNLRETDSLNAALIESLIAGNIVISGAWLPYSFLRKIGAFFYEVDAIEEITELIPKLLENFEETKLNLRNNNVILRKFFSKENLVKDWLNLYKE